MKFLAQFDRFAQFIRFAQVGVFGFIVDWACLTFFLWAGTGFFIGRALSYLCAATSTWAVNRHWTFADRDQGAFRQWARFLSANAVGGMFNYGVSVAVAVVAPVFIGKYPVFAVAAGSISGLFFNYTLSKRYVFRK